MLMEGASEEDIKLIRSQPIKPEVKPEVNTDEKDENGSENGENGEKRRDKFSRHNDESEDETSEKNDNPEKKRKGVFFHFSQFFEWPKLCLRNRKKNVSFLTPFL